VKFLADECCDHGLVGALRQSGYDVLYVLESERGATDDDVLSLAFREQRIILAEDKDFGELVYRLKKPAHGIILIRIAVKNRIYSGLE
jgi:predicted nuclease of predicted toxin-antitoxin system